MTRVRGPVVSPTLKADHKTVIAEQFDEGITTRHLAGVFKNTLHKKVQFGAAKTGIVPAVFAYLFNYQGLNGILSVFLIIPLVIGLSAITKQPAKGPETMLGTLLAEQTYRLVPDFFLIGILNVSSATLIIVS